MKLTKTQKIAVETTQADILVSAGAGAGKTRVLVERFLHFVISGKARVTEILTLTFTDKAANEMKTRIMKRFQAENMLQARRDLELAYISTLHAFASRLLKEHPVEAGVAPDFSVIEAEESDLYQEKTFDELLETHCAAGSDWFELLKIYGEASLRKGIKKVYTKARTEGLSLADFFERQRDILSEPQFKAAERERVKLLFEKVKEPAHGETWERFFSQAEWDWKMLEDFRAWADFGKKGGKDTKVYWKEIIKACDLLEGEQLNLLAAPWREKFEKAALSFESAYEARKFEAGVLDFDDLQIRALSLLTSPAPGNRKWLEHYRRHFKFVLVDEYQDVNPLQVKLVECFSPAPQEKEAVSPGEGKMFFVGDYKQSIYGFRGTSPRHFRDKHLRYQKQQGGLLIEMMENFRTQAPLLDFINSFFEKLWMEDGLSDPGLAARADEDQPKAAELLVLRQEEEESIEQARLREASALARKIRSLHEEDGIPYGEMAVLFQAATNFGIYEHALRLAGIPYFSVSGRGFYHQPEIRDLISLLSVIENPLLDIPLAAVLRSPFFRVSDDALFWLARAAKKAEDTAPLFNGLKMAPEIFEISDQDKENIKTFLVFFTQLLAVKDRFFLWELLEWIIQQTAYELPVLAGRQGVRRYANLRKLVSLAREEESRQRVPLGDFIRLVEGYEAREVRESEAQVEAEQSGRMVRLMTIHAAKGLEFPVCFVADLAYTGSNQESRDFLAEAELGYSFKISNPVTLEMESPGAYRGIDKNAQQQETEEWKRLFYVAVTRARKRLILSGVYDPPKKPKDSFNEMKSWMDWVMTAAADLPIAVEEISAGAGRLVRPSQKLLAEDPVFRGLLESESKIEKIFPAAKERAALSSRAEELYRRMESYEVLPGRVLDLPVSAYCAFLKNKMEYWRIYEMGFSSADAEMKEYGQIENGRRDEDESVSAADFGTLIHRVLERLDFRNPKPQISQLSAQIFSGLGTKKAEEAAALLNGFIRSDLFKRMQSAKRLYKEIPFLLNERHGRVDGVIDALFQDVSGKWTIVDYKTAVGNESRVQESAYDFQMGIYGLAVWELLRVVPGSAELYFLRNQWVHAIAFGEHFLSGERDKLRRLQQEILDFRTGMSKSVAFSLGK